MRRHGFTLLELLVVLAIMGLIMGSTLAGYFAIGQGARLRGAVNTIESNLALARQRTILHQVPLSVVFYEDPPNSDLWHYHVEEANSTNLIGEVMHVPPGVEVTWISSDSITFQPSGGAGEATMEITLSETTGTGDWVLTVYGLTGLVKVTPPGSGP
ncbi:MAG: prepilin-type N-terminal cleavage/methylation domain-containing protein [Kiritimatiellia bacterium]|jgi:prepilin-type N-terminal cleavage/methylation domain-containing protein|nr:prepilin-type N-terminal cleavage/methylation domain-containing protein [Kiritimatiellia bacterium]